MAKKLLIIDRDGTLIKEAPPTYRIDSWNKLEFYPHVFEFMHKIAAQTPFDLIMVTNQDGLGDDDFPEDKFWPIQDFIIRCFENEGVHFSAVHIDKSYPWQNLSTRKPGTGLFLDYLDNPLFDLQKSFVIGDRITDVQLAKNLGCKAIWLNNESGLGASETENTREELQPSIALETNGWKEIYAYLKAVDSISS